MEIKYNPVLILIFFFQLKNNKIYSNVIIYLIHNFSGHSQQSSCQISKLLHQFAGICVEITRKIYKINNLHNEQALKQTHSLSKVWVQIIQFKQKYEIACYRIDLQDEHKQIQTSKSQKRRQVMSYMTTSFVRGSSPVSECERSMEPTRWTAYPSL